MAQHESVHTGSRTDPVSLSYQTHPTTPLIASEAVEFLFHVMGNRRPFFDEVRPLLRSHYFTLAESTLASVWEAMCTVASRSSGKFTYEALAFTLREQFHSYQVRLAPELEYWLFAPSGEGLLWFMTNTGYSDEHVGFARQLLQRFLYERTVVLPLRKIMASPSGMATYPQNIHELLGEYHFQSSRLSAMNELPRVAVAPDRSAVAYVPPAEFRLTGVPFIDLPLGGQRMGDCNGIVGVTGGGKTTLGIYMGVEGARAAWAESLAACEAGVNTSPELVVYITVEETAKKLLPRIWSAAFAIDRAKLERMQDWSELTTPENMADYERVAPADGRPVIFSSEVERYDAGRQSLSSSFELLDFSGSDEYPDVGIGYVPEIVSALDRLQQVRQQRIRTVIVDYAGLVVERHAGQELDDRKLRVGLKRIGDDTRKLVAERFQCTVWLLHQLRGEAATFSPARLMTHTDAAESKDFANNLAVCGCLGVADPVNGCRRLNWSKTRGVRNEAVAPVTLRINERFARMEDVTPDFIIDEGTRRFLSREEAQQVMGAAVGTSQRLMAGPGSRNVARPGQAASIQAALGDGGATG